MLESELETLKFRVGTSVNLRSKGARRKSDRFLRDIDLSPAMNMKYNYSYIGFQGISVHRKNCEGPMKSLRKKHQIPTNVIYVIRVAGTCRPQLP